MTELSELKNRIELLENHAVKLEGIIQVMLDELADGAIEDSATRLREILDQTERGF